MGGEDVGEKASLRLQTKIDGMAPDRDTHLGVYEAKYEVARDKNRGSWDCWIRGGY